MKILRILMNRIGNLWQSRAKRRKVVTVLACIVVFTTVYALIMPAITLTQKAAWEMAGINIEETAIVGEITAETEQNADYSVAINVDAKAGIPAGTTAKVREILPDSKDYDYKILYEKAQEAVTAARGKNFDIRQIHLYTLNLLNEGEEIRPEAPVKVRFSYNKGINLFERDLLTAISLPVNEDGMPKNEKGTLVAPEKIMPESEDNGADAESATFKMSEISLIAIAELKDISAGTLSAGGEDYSITIQYGKNAGIPMGSVLSVSEIGRDTEEYRGYYAKAADTISADSLDFARFFDVTISYDGEKLEPEAPVSVQISYDDPLEVSEEQEVQAIHFAESNGVETPELLSINDKSSEAEGNKEKITDITFQQGSFSVVGTIVSPVSSGWPNVDSTTPQVMIIKGNDNNYYAVQHNGALTEVVYENNKVTFPSSIQAIGDLSDYYWYLEKSGHTRRIGYNGTYIYPRNNNGLTTQYADKAYLLRDTFGHIYDTYTNYYTYYYYLKTNSDNTAIQGGGSSSSNSSVFFVSSFEVQNESTWPEEDSTYYMVVTPDNNSYYAVNTDGSLVPVTIPEINGALKVKFGASTSVSEDDLNNFKWDLSDGTDTTTRRISSTYPLNDGNTAYISPANSSGRSTSAAVDLLRDNAGHIYTLDSNGSYHYLSMVANNTIAGNENGGLSTDDVSPSACGVSFYKDAVIATNGGGSSGENSENNPLGEPTAAKTLTDNNDGTYDLALSVTGKTTSLKEGGKVNVYIIFDTSYSMFENTVRYTDSSGTQQERTRLDVSKEAIQTAASALIAQNAKPEIPDDSIQISLITFNNHAETVITTDPETTDPTVFNTTVGNITISENDYSGTNWEAAFSETASAIQNNSNGRPNAQNYVIFVSDGNPTFRNTLGDYYTNQTYYKEPMYNGYICPKLGYTNPHFTDYAINGVGRQTGLNYSNIVYTTEQKDNADTIVKTFTSDFIPDTRPDFDEADGLYGTGLDGADWALKDIDNNSDTNYYATDVNTNINRCYNEAKNEALSLGYFGDTTHYDAEFYSISAFGDADRMNSITRYVITGSDTGNIPENRAFDATSKDELTDAFDSIVSQILVDFMYTNVTVSDGLTEFTNSEAKVGSLLSEPDFRYYKYGGKYDATLYADKGGYQYGTAETPTEITNEVNTSWPEENRAHYDPSTGNVTWKICSSKKTDGTDAQWCDINPSGNDMFHLENGVTYVVKFRVWPDQEAYDTLSDIHNAGSVARDVAYGSLSDDLKSKIYKNEEGNYVARPGYETDLQVQEALTNIVQAGKQRENEIFNALSDDVKDVQIYKDNDGEYRLHTNTSASVTYDVLKRTVEQPGPGKTGVSIDSSGTKTLDNPEGMILTDTTMKVYKVWEGDVSGNRPASVTLTIYEGDGATGANEHQYQTITLPNPNTGANTWEYTIYISPALMKTDTGATPDEEGNYPIITLEEGHTYRVDEVESSSVYTYTGETVRPFLLDTATNVKTNGTNAQGLTAKNTIRKTSVILKKSNDAESLTSQDFQYLNHAHFQLLRKEVTGIGTDGYPEYRYVNYSVTDSEGNLTSYKDFEVSDGSTGFTFNNLPVGEYKLVELSAPDGYVMVEKEIYFKVNDPEISENALSLDKYVAKKGYEDDSEVRTAIANSAQL